MFEALIDDHLFLGIGITLIVLSIITGTVKVDGATTVDFSTSILGRVVLFSMGGAFIIVYYIQYVDETEIAYRDFRDNIRGATVTKVGGDPCYIKVKSKLGDAAIVYVHGTDFSHTAGSSNFWVFERGANRDVIQTGVSWNGQGFTKRWGTLSDLCGS